MKPVLVYVNGKWVWARVDERGIRWMPEGTK